MSLDPRIIGPPCIGELYCGVFDYVEAIDDGLVKVFDIGMKREALLTGVSWDEGRRTLLNLQVVDDEILCLSFVEHSQMLVFRHDRNTFSKTTVELCAGSGAMGIGPLFLGAEVKVAVDSNRMACDHLRSNNHGTVIEKSILDPSIVHDIYELLGETPATFLAGYPCQPHSHQGMRLGQQDPRAKVFWAVLRLSFLLQAQALITESVAAAAADPALHNGFRRSLCVAMDWQYHDLELRLEHQWPMTRSRWWCLCFPSQWGSSVVPWTRSYAHPTVDRVLPQWGLFSEREEMELELDSHEYAFYMATQSKDGFRFLTHSSVCPTILRSYSNCFRSCPCECRSQPFSEHSLLTYGLRGFFIQSERSGMPRYLHPAEVATLLGVPMSMRWNGPTRSMLSLLGLVASPIQSLWMYSQLVNAAAEHVPDLHPLQSEEVLELYKKEILRQVKAEFPFAVPVLPRTLTLFEEDEHPVNIFSDTAATVAQLVQAEAISLGWGKKTIVTFGRTGSFALDSQMLPTDHEIIIERRSKRQCVERPAGQIMVLVNLASSAYVSFLTPGSFLFQVLWEHGLPTDAIFTDVNGKIFGPDLKIWHSLTLDVLHASRFPTIIRPLTLDSSAAGLLHGAGSGSDGLDEHAVWSAMTDLAGNIPCHLVPPVRASFAVRGFPVDFNFMGSLDSDSKIFSIFEADGHWALLYGRVLGDGIQWIYMDGLDFSRKGAAFILAKHLTHAAGLGFVALRCLSIINQVNSSTCGTIAVAHMTLALGLTGTFTPDVIDRLHGLLARRNRAPSLLIGFGPDLQARLAALLATKGVPSEAAAPRAEAAIKKLGHSSVETAIKQTNPWQALKGLTTKPGHGFQFVQKDELKAFVTAKATSKHGASISSKKKEKKVSRKDSTSTWNLDPKLLSIDPSHFVDPDEDHVLQITLSEVVAEARGVAVCTAQEAIPYMKESRNISSDALALLITEDIPADQRGGANIASLRFPATFTPTKDPLLINGCLLQLGDTEVSRNSPADTAEPMDIVATAVLKVQIFRDEVHGDWDQLAAAPIRALIKAIPVLRLCSDLRCNMKCGAFHPSVEDNIDQVIHEIWARRFQTLEGRQCPSASAAVFQAFLRIAIPACDSILKTNVDGIYFEPRSDGLRSTSPDYAVIWLPGANHEMAIHKLKLTTHGMSLVRLKQRFGIRVPTEHEKAAHKELRPGDEFLKVAVTLVYRLHPLPHGLQRSQVAKLLSEISWVAKPLQPAKGSMDGAAWDVGSSSPPPSTVLQAMGRDILVTLVKDKSEPDSTPTVIGPKRVQTHLQRSAAPASASSDLGGPAVLILTPGAAGDRPTLCATSPPWMALSSGWMLWANSSRKMSRRRWKPDLHRLPRLPRWINMSFASRSWKLAWVSSRLKEFNIANGLKRPMLV